MTVDDPISVGSPDLPAGDDSVDVRVLASGAAVLLPRSLRSLTPEQQEIAAVLQGAAREILDLQRLVAGALRAGRESGMSWASLGWLIGLTGPGARKMLSRWEEE